MRTREAVKKLMKTEAEREAAKKMKAKMMKKKTEAGGDEFTKSPSLRHLKRRRFLNSTASNDHRSASSSPNNVSTGISKLKPTITDLQDVSTGVVEMPITATFDVEETERNQKTALSNLGAEETKLEKESTGAPPSTATRSPEAMMPPEAEIEEFFSAAEKDLQDQFSKKYNFDVVKGEALEGRYEWSEMK